MTLPARIGPSQPAEATLRKATLPSSLPISYALVLPLVIAAVLVISQHWGPTAGVATLAYAAMISAIINRRDRRLHIAGMCFAVIVDTALVLFLTVTADAVGQVLTPSLSFPQWVHVVSSTTAVLLYLPLIILGRKARRLSASPRLRRSHRLLGVTAISARTIGFVFMFSMADAASAPKKPACIQQSVEDCAGSVSN